MTQYFNILIEYYRLIHVTYFCLGYYIVIVFEKKSPCLFFQHPGLWNLQVWSFFTTSTESVVLLPSSELVYEKVVRWKAWKGVKRYIFCFTDKLHIFPQLSGQICSQIVFSMFASDHGNQFYALYNAYSWETTNIWLVYAVIKAIG
jgi:hypothetical protein